MNERRLQVLLQNAGIEKEIKGTCSIGALRPGYLAYLADSRYAKEITPNADGMILCAPDCEPAANAIAGNRVIVHPAAALVFFRIHNEFYAESASVSYHGPWMKEYPEAKISTQAVIGKNFQPGAGVTVAPFAVIGDDVSLGNRSFVHSGAVIGDRVRVGADCVLAPHCVLGNTGFRLFRDEGGDPWRLAHKAAVLLGDYVEIGSFCSVDRGVFQDTVIEDFVKIDNQVHVGHNARVGKGSFLCAGSIVGGSSIIEENVWLGLNVATADHITVGEEAFLSMGAIVTKNVPAKAKVSGNFAIDHERFVAFVKSIA